MDIGKYKFGEIQTDEFGKASGILLVNKPKDTLSHDIVWYFRKKFGVKAIGHAGALDPFAEGLLIILIGKATKLSDHFLGMDKEYEADVLFGIATDSGDVEGEATNFQLVQLDQFPIEQVQNVLESFRPCYRQFVPIYSSVKVNGDKLRVLARKFDRFETQVDIVDGEIKKTVKFFSKENEIKKEVELPAKNIKIHEIALLELVERNPSLPLLLKKEGELNAFPVAKVKVNCSKGTYIRQLAIDIGEKYGEMFSENSKPVPSMLIDLKRTRIGGWGLEDSGVYQFNEAEIEDLQARAKKFTKQRSD